MKKGELEAELDGLILLDTAVFLVEAKSGTLTEQARRAAKKGMKHNVERLIQEAYAQASRAKDYVQSSDKSTFRLSDVHYFLTLVFCMAVNIPGQYP